MKKLRFEIEINSPKEKVWETLWQDKTLRQWAALVDLDTYMVGELIEGETVQFNSKEGYGVTSHVKHLIPNEYVLFKHDADTKDYGDDVREDQWTGSSESYALDETDGVTTLVLEFDAPEELQEIMNASYPKSLNKIKELAESVQV